MSPCRSACEYGNALKLYVFASTGGGNVVLVNTAIQAASTGVEPPARSVTTLVIG